MKKSIISLILFLSAPFLIGCAAAADNPQPPAVVETYTASPLAYSAAAHFGIDFTTDYLAEMVDCCVSGNDDLGRELSYKRSLKKAVIGDNSPDISYDDLLLLSKVIMNECGSSWLSMEWKMKVGEVLLNRVASPEFANTLSGCVYSPGQYQGVHSERFRNLRPNLASAQAAARLLAGERLLCDPSVVFQANFRQGSGIHEVLRDSTLGDTYLCYSSHPDLYSK